MNLISALKQQARALKKQSLTVYCIARHPNAPLMVKLLGFVIAAYILSPIDLIPDFIPAIGYLDDLILVPLGIALIIHLTPESVISEARCQAETLIEKPVSYGAAIFIALIWLALAAWAIQIFYQP